MKPVRAQHHGIRRAEQGGGGFTLIELLVVISVIAVLAALIVGVAPRAMEKRSRSRAQALISEVTVAIDSYKGELGFYPPENQRDGANRPPVYSRPPLYYSLKGTIQNPDFEFITLDGESHTSEEIKAEFGIDGFVNSASSRSQVKDFYPNLRSGHVAKDQGGFKYLVIPAKGPNGSFNPVHYDASSTNRHNASSYDIWVDLVVRGKTVRIGNWRE